jgi:hypothetical protein
MGRRLTVQLAAPATMYLWDHIVAGRSILPGAAMLETALAAGRALGAADWAPLGVTSPRLPRTWTGSRAHLASMLPGDDSGKGGRCAAGAAMSGWP